ncbi:PTS HPr component phosphorylation site [Lachnospiraceae bacterium KHCPX20]|nr:PTS HPr component phosphorylation site [Lachnospiraceae bacterium KHCPX20]
MTRQIKCVSTSDMVEFVQAANKCDCDIDIQKGGYMCSGKSILGVLALDLTTGAKLIANTINENDIEPLTKWFR